MRLFLVAALAVSFINPVMAGGHLESERSGKGDRFAKIDTNGDGAVSREEFLAVAAERFSKMDADGNGSLSKEEMKSRRKKHRH